MALWKEAATEPFGGAGGSLGTYKRTAATVGTAEGLWHCGRKLQQSLSGGQAAVSEPYKRILRPVALWEEAAAKPFGGAGGSLGTMHCRRPVALWEEAFRGGKRQSRNRTKGLCGHSSVEGSCSRAFRGACFGTVEGSCSRAFRGDRRQSRNHRKGLC